MRGKTFGLAGLCLALCVVSKFDAVCSASESWSIKTRVIGIWC